MTKNKENPFLNLYLGTFKQPWLNYCAHLGKKPGVAIKEAIQAQLIRAANQPEFNGLLFKQLKNKPDKGKKKRLVLQLTPTEHEKLALLAELSGCSSQRWVTNIIRILLTREPQCDMREIQVLGESNYQLLAIGRNLNQIAKQLNQSLPTTPLSEEIKELKKTIGDHTDLVSKTLRANVDRWVIE